MIPIIENEDKRVLLFKCQKCKKSYVVDSSNTRILGPLINTICQHCSFSIVNKNMSSFVLTQVSFIEGNINKAVYMQEICQLAEKLINDAPKGFGNVN